MALRKSEKSAVITDGRDAMNCTKGDNSARFWRVSKMKKCLKNLGKTAAFKVLNDPYHYLGHAI